MLAKLLPTSGPRGRPGMADEDAGMSRPRAMELAVMDGEVVYGDGDRGAVASCRYRPPHAMRNSPRW